MVERGRERLVAEHARGPRPSVRSGPRGSSGPSGRSDTSIRGGPSSPTGPSGPPCPGEPVPDPGQVAFPEPDGGEGLTALGRERDRPLPVAGIAERREHRFHVVQGQRDGGQPGRRPRDPQVGEEPVGLEREHEPAIPGQRERRLARPVGHPSRQAAIALPEQGIDHPRGEVALSPRHLAAGTAGAARTARAASAASHGSRSTISQFPAARRAVTASSTAAGSAPTALITPR